ncbi:protein LEAD-SENSITIVE 1-like [Salvia miltiorrhiza]|uniref:protein LEAD-SENSITIVE 1-like n=1 Tax=Salvia miltiorrhiza TaxID=226208 RepID=UPI0025ABDCB8|nr:protein LEAD-SENSITIVE 1-like [Salvia miltiorrhiza]
MISFITIKILSSVCVCVSEGERERSELKAGDHIYTRRIIYSHHGIYVGDGKVVHYVGLKRLPSSSSSSSSSSAWLSSSSSSATPPCSVCEALDQREHKNGVLISCLDCFLKGGWLYRYEYGMSKWGYPKGTYNAAESAPAEVVTARAAQLLQDGFGEYSLMSNNCEDFATFCKIGRHSGIYGQGSAADAPLHALSHVP